MFGIKCEKNVLSDDGLISECNNSEVKKKMESALRFRLLVSSLILFVVAFGINVILNSSSVDKLCEEAAIASYKVIGENLQRKLVAYFDSEYQGSESDNFEDILNKAKTDLIKQKKETFRKSEATESRTTSEFSISVVNPEGTITQSTEKKDIGTKLSDKIFDSLISVNEKSDPKKNADFFKHGDFYFLSFPVKIKSKNINPTVIIAVSKNVIQINKNLLINQKYILLIWIFCGGSILLVLVLRAMTGRSISGQSFSKTKISFMLFFFICGAQIAFSTVTAISFTELYIEINKEKAKIKVGLLKDSLEGYIMQNIMIKDISNGDILLSEILDESAELNDITIFDDKWHPLFIATREKTLNCQSATLVQIERMKQTLPLWDPKYNVRLDILAEDQIMGYISTNLSKKSLYSRLVDISLDALTLLVISILFLVEMIILIFNFVKAESEPKQPVSIKDESTIGGVHYGMMRPAAFLLLFGYDISMSFIPLHTENLYAPLFGLSKDVIMGLPISVELLFVGICILVSGVWLDRRGWHEPFLTGIIMAGVGILYSWGAPDVLNFIISRAITGSGYGLALMASQGFVIEFSDSRSKARGLAYLFAGIYAGSLCGGATGAMLADRFDYNSVFLAGALIIFSVILYCFLFMRKGMTKPQSQLIDTQNSQSSVKSVTNFLSNRIVIALIFFSSLPAAIAVVGFLNYFSPIYLNRIGASQAAIGRILMIYGICLIYIGPLISRYVDASNKKRLYIFNGCLLGALAFMTFNIVDGIIAAAIAALMLGLSSSFVLASQSAYTLRLKVTAELGAGKSIGIFRSTSRGGQVLGPIVFSSLILVTNIEDGITILGIGYFIFALIFLLLTMKDKKLLSF